MFRSPTHSYAPSVVSDPFATSAPPAFGQPRNNRFSSPPVASSTSSASTRLLPAYSSSAGSNGNRTLPRAPSIPHTQDATSGNRALRDEQLSGEMVRRLEEDYAQESRHEHFEPPPQRRHTGENKQRLRQCANLLRDLHDKLGKLQTEVAAASGGPSHEDLKAMLVKFEGEIERVLDRAVRSFSMPGNAAYRCVQRGVHQQAQLDLHGRSY